MGRNGGSTERKREGGGGMDIGRNAEKIGEGPRTWEGPRTQEEPRPREVQE